MGISPSGVGFKDEGYLQHSLRGEEGNLQALLDLLFSEWRLVA